MCRVLLVIAFSVLPCQGLQAGEWVDGFKVGPFQLRSEFKLTEKHSLIKQLTRLQADLKTILQIEPSNRPIEINLFRSKGNYVNYLSERVPEGVGRQALFVEGSDMGRVYLYRNYKYQTDLRHEVTHAILHNALPYVPLWLDEGLAEYFEVPAKQRISGNSYLRSIRLALFIGWKPHLSSLEEMSDVSEMRGSHYRDSWACVHFCLNGSAEAKQTLVQYLKKIQKNDPPGRFSSHLERVHPRYESLIAAHIKRWK